MNYIFYQGYPYYPLGKNEGFFIRNFNVCHVKDDKILKEWDFTGLPEDLPKEWLSNLWRDLDIARFESRADQWSSEYYSILGNRIIFWSDDRHENTSFIYGSYPVENCMENPSLPDNLKKWLKGNLKHLTEKNSPGPPKLTD